MLPLPMLPDPVRLMMEGLDLVMRGARTAAAAELTAERAYGFVWGIETVKALSPDTIDSLYDWIEATHREVLQNWSK